jgi:hypothetical protein
MEMHLRGSFWSEMAGFNINTAGFVIVGMFVLTWAVALGVWRYGNIEEKWNAKLRSGPDAAPVAAASGPRTQVHQVSPEPSSVLVSTPGRLQTTKT